MSSHTLVVTGGVDIAMDLEARRQRGHASRRQGFYAECVVQAVAAAAGLRVSKEQPEPEGVDLLITMVRKTGYPKRQRIELQVKSTADPTVIDNCIRLSLPAESYRELNGVVGVDFDLPRFLVVVDVPRHFSDYCHFGESAVELSHHAYWADLMGRPRLPTGQGSTTVSVPRSNLLTSAALVELVCGSGEEAERWLSA